MDAPSPESSFAGYSVARVRRAGAPYKARVLEGAGSEGPCILKELSAMRPLLRTLYGRRMLEREARALERLDGFPYAPRLLRRISRDAIAIELIPFRHMRKKMGEPRLQTVIEGLDTAVRELHARGVVHLDLRQKKNILVGPEGEVVLIDFESALDLSRGVLRSRLVLPILRRVDQGAVLKWKAKFLPEQLTPVERRRVARYRFWKRFWFWKRLARRARRMFEPAPSIARARP